MSDSPVAPAAHRGFIEQLQQAVRGEVLTDVASRGMYATDASLYQIMPQAIVVARDADDCVAAIKVAHAHGVPITPRGGGTSLSGQTFGPGLVIDCSKYMDQILEVNAQEKWARVQPGAVRDIINAKLKDAGLHFAPDPATSSRATVGGILGNNTSGTRSIVYGKGIDHILACKVALADGTVIDCRPMDDDAWQRKCQQRDREGEIYRGVRDLILKYQDEIRDRYPKVLRRVSGYNLDEYVDGAGYTGDIGPRREHNQGHRVWSLANLIVGSEGTLGYVLEATIRLTPNPKATAVCVVHFDDLIASLRAVDPMLEHRPSTVEMLDETVMDEAKVNPATRDMAGFIQGSPAAVQIVEMMGETPAEAEAKIRAFADAMRERGIGYAWPVFTDARGQSDVWETRKLGLGLISNVYGSNKGRDFIEDACVPTSNLAEYISKIQRLCAEHGVTRLSLYAHASVGVIHVVPALDLHDPEQVAKMQAIAEQAFQWVMDCGGSWSGEHGDGQLRGQFLPRMFGDTLYQAFRELKGVFDPDNLMNPGKIVDAPAMTTNLRYQAPGYNQRIAEVAPNFHYREQGGFALAVEQCNGVGACRKVGTGTMCPSYMATRDEETSTRGRANTLRMAMSGQLGAAPMAALASDEVMRVLSLCLACKACKSECPNAVDMARLKSDVLQMRHDEKGVPVGYKILGEMPIAARQYAGRLAPWIARAGKLPGARAVMHKLTGIDPRRPLPPFARVTLDALLKQHHLPRPRVRTRGTVVLFDDTYANYMEPNVGLAAVQLLEACGYRVILAKAGCCQRPRLSKGLVRDAKRDGTKTMENLDVFAKQGLPILCLEPSCASAIGDDLPDLIDDVELGRRVKQHVHMIDVFLEREGVELTSDHADLLLHGHCHQKALFGTAAMKRLFADMPDVHCSEVDSGCCGMAGSFGYEHYDVSKKIGEDRLFPAVRDAVANGKTIVASGISCRHQLHDFLGVKAKHWVEVVKPREEEHGR